MLDLIVIGAGLVGLATAYQFLLAHPESGVCVLEKEADVALHQSGHNSGVIHTGVYYKPGSAKALSCRTGRDLLLRYCSEHGVPYKLCGKVIVATEEVELAGLQAIHRRAEANGIESRIIGAAEVKEIEPAVSAKEALHVPGAGVIDFKQMADSLAQQIRLRGGAIELNSRVMSLAPEKDCIRVVTSKREHSAKALVNCAGLHSDIVHRMVEPVEDLQICPFRGEYYLLRPSAAALCRALIYPVPDPRFPFLGVHLTRGINGEVECGPNAVLALSREGYRWSSIDFRELQRLANFSGLHSFLKKHWREGAAEIYRSLSKAAFTRAVRRLVPEITEQDLTSGGSGVRAQALTRSGMLVDDFEIRQIGPIVSVLNAPSPAATSCLSIGRSIVSKLDKK